MKVRYLSLYRLSGASKLANPFDVEIYSTDSPNLQVYVTEKPEEAFLIINRASALAKLISTSIFGSTLGITVEQALSDEIARLTSAEKPNGVYVVFDGITEIECTDIKPSQYVGNLQVVLDAIDKLAVRATFAPITNYVLTALKLGNAEGADGQTEQVGIAIVLLDGDREIYPFTVEIGTPRLSLARPLTTEGIERAARLAKVLTRQTYLERVTRLFVESSKRQTDPLFAFIAAWSSLEVFVSTTFKKRYQKRWYTILEEGVPKSAKVVINRFEAVMSDKLRLADKFAVIAAILDAAGAEADIDEFLSIKKIRDDFFHTPEPGTVQFPLDEIQALLCKYLGLHLDDEIRCKYE